MEKILLMTDSACDLSLEEEAAYGIRVLNIPLYIHGEQKIDRAEVSADEIYRILNTENELPTTAHLNMVDFAQAYKAAADEGYTSIIYVGINSKGSGTFEASLMGRELFFEHCPEYVGQVQIHNVDSRAYSYGYGYPLVLAADAVQGGSSTQEVLDLLVDALDHRELYFSMFTLKFAKKSGRISAAASFMGELMGLRPIMAFPDGKNVTADKVRGDKNVVPKLFELYKSHVDPAHPEYAVLYGEDEAPADALIQLIEAYNGQKPRLKGKMGVCVSINAGPQIVGLTFRGKEGGKYTAEVR